MILTVDGETLAIVLSLLDNVIESAAGAGAESDTVNGVEVPKDVVTVDGATTLPALWTVTVVVASGMNGVTLA